MKHGVNSSHSQLQHAGDICQDLHCHKDRLTYTSHPALEGTTCSPAKWCRRGRCVDNPNAAASSSSAVATGLSWTAGVGGEWGDWTECRSPCLHGADGILSSGSSGLSLSRRRCRRGWCDEEYRYRLCSGSGRCGSERRRTVQDWADLSCTRRARARPQLTGLASKLPTHGVQECEVQCETRQRGVERTGQHFPDGVVCQSPGALPAYCVAGVCTEFRCESNSMYGADPLTCRPDVGDPGPYRPLGPSQPHPVLPAAHWGSWNPTSTCRASCLDGAMGFQLVGRQCQGRGCSGVNKNIMICTPRNQECEEVEETFQYAGKVCRRFQDLHRDKLSGAGMQLASTKDDPDRSCKVACQDARLIYRFYRVNGREGWFPFGTSCRKNENALTTSYCLNGKCLEFAEDGTPLRNTIYTEFERSQVHSLEPIEVRVPKIVETAPLAPTRSPQTQGWLTWGRRRRNVVPSSHALYSTITDHQLLTLVDQLNQSMSARGAMDNNSPTPIDFNNPLFVDDPSQQEGSRFVLPSNTYSLSPLVPDAARQGPSAVSLFDEEVAGPLEYSWRVRVVSPCSVTCGSGVEEVVSVCVVAGARPGREEEVGQTLCAHEAPPERNGYRNCRRSGICSRHPHDASQTVFGRLIQEWVHLVISINQ